MALEMAHTDGKVIHTWIFLCHEFLEEFNIKYNFEVEINREFK